MAPDGPVFSSITAADLAATQAAPIDDNALKALAGDMFLISALESTIVRGVKLERFLTSLRRTLLRLTDMAAAQPDRIGADVAELFCALAQQCFLNEYIFAQDDDEAVHVARLRDLLIDKASSGSAVDPFVLAAVAAYMPLHTVAEATLFLDMQQSPYVDRLLRQQVREPLEEAVDRAAIPALTSIDDVTSRAVMQQYEENPYPRWIMNPLSALSEEAKRRLIATSGFGHGGQDILIAGCGTGEHPFDIAQKAPDARILAVDLSLASLAYARRKTREEGLRNIEYAQADILNLATLGRTFDHIESVGVLHHLASPMAGWRVLLPLLALGGVMRVGLYSAAARRPIVEARAVIAERGYRPTAADIRAMRQTIIREQDDPRWKLLIATVDFYSMSGCRDMLFNIMEHRLTIPEIAAFLKEQNLSFLGFELDAKTVEAFGQRYRGPEALANLDHWHAFETANPQTFSKMYMFSVRKNEPAAA
jgi:SAM-dependent methyltransferase